MSILPQAHRLTVANLDNSYVAPSLFPAPGAYDDEKKTRLTYKLSPPSYTLKGAPFKTFGSSAQRIDTLDGHGSSKASPGPGAYETPPGVVDSVEYKDYNVEYEKVSRQLSESRIFASKEGPEANNKLKNAKTPHEKPRVRPRDKHSDRFKELAADEYTWLLGPGSYKDSTQDFGFQLKKRHESRFGRSRRNGRFQKNHGNTRGAGNSGGVKPKKKQRWTSPDRLPSEGLIIGYNNSQTQKDFNKIYKRVSEQMTNQRYLKNTRGSEKTWKKQLEKMKAQHRKPASRFKAPAPTFGSAVRFDFDDKRKLGTLEPGPGQYEYGSCFPADTPSAIAVAKNLALAARRIAAAEGRDDNDNGVDDALEAEAALPAFHVVRNTSSFLGEDRDAQKFLQRYGKGGSSVDVPSPLAYRPNPTSTLVQESSNILALRNKKLLYQGRPIVQDKNVRSKSSVGAEDGKQSSDADKTLENCAWFSRAGAPSLSSIQYSVEKKQSLTRSRSQIQKLPRSAKQIDTMKLGQSFFRGSPTGRKYLLSGEV